MDSLDGDIENAIQTACTCETKLSAFFGIKVDEILNCLKGSVNNDVERKIEGKKIELILKIKNKIQQRKGGKEKGEAVV